MSLFETLIHSNKLAIQKDGVVLSGQCTWMAGISQVCNYVGALLYKCMQQNTEEVSSTSKSNKWLPARKTVPP